MSKKLDEINARLAELQENNVKLMQQNKKLEQTNLQLVEKCEKYLSQIARGKIPENQNQAYREKIRRVNYADMLETAIAVFTWDKLKPSPRNIFNSKRIEQQIANSPTTIFPWKYKGYRHAKPPEDVNTYLALPFIGVDTIEFYGEFPLIQPYSPSGDTRTNIGKPLIVNEECIVVSDYFQYAQTNANNSFTVQEAIQTYCDLIADVEMTKKINRNWLKIPFMWDVDGFEEKNERAQINQVISEVADIVRGVEDGASSIVTKWAARLKIMNTDIAFYGQELEEVRKDYENQLFNFLGIGTIRNENRARKINAEIDVTEDQYNINLTKRLQNRQMNLDVAKRIFPAEDWKDVYLKVNLQGYYAYNHDEVATEDNEDAAKGGDNATN